MPPSLPRRAAVLLTLATACAPLFAQSAAPAAWPSKPLRVLVGFPAGSTPDLVARTIAEPLSKALGQPVVVDNRPGAGGNIAATLVAQSTDQHTIGVMINGNLTTARLLNPATPYDPAKDLAPISLIGTAPLVLVVPAGVAGGAQDVLAAGRAAGSDWSYGSPGVGTVGHIGMELLKARTGMAPVHVPYPGNPQVIQALLGGQLQLALLPPGLVAPQVRTGRLKAVGVTSTVRSALAPEIPSLAEGGLVAGFELEIWNAAAAPASLPVPIVSRLSTLIGEIVRRPEVREKLFQQGWQVAGTSAEGLGNRMRADTAALGSVIAQRGIKAE
jgi:tripartite-type tricarboxylate transporter receptor subunit TctC